MAARRTGLHAMNQLQLRAEGSLRLTVQPAIARRRWHIEAEATRRRLSPEAETKALLGNQLLHIAGRNNRRTGYRHHCLGVYTSAEANGGDTPLFTVRSEGGEFTHMSWHLDTFASSREHATAENLGRDPLCNVFLSFLLFSRRPLCPADISFCFRQWHVGYAPPFGVCSSSRPPLRPAGRFLQDGFGGWRLLFTGPECGDVGGDVLAGSRRRGGSGRWEGECGAVDGLDMRWRCTFHS